MHRRISVLFVALALAACSGGGGSVGSPGASPKPASIAVSIGAATALTQGESFPINVVVTNAAGQVVNGQYASPVTLTTSDAVDTGFSSTYTGSNLSPSVSIGSSTQPVFFVYDGTTVSTPIVLTAASANVTSQQYTFTPQSGTTSTTSSAIASLTVVANGAAPQIGSGGSFTLTVAGYAASGALVTGTYTNPITLTSNDSTDLTFSVNGGAAAPSAKISAATDIVVVNYDGSAVPAGTTISASASGVPTVSIPFTPQAAGSAPASAISKITIAQVGAPPNQGTPGQFTLALTAYDSTGKPISGTYPTSVVISTNDSTDLSLSTTASGTFTPSVTITNGATVVYVNYSGGQVPQSTAFAATAGATVQAQLTFNPAVTSTTALYINKLYITTAGAQLAANSYGSMPIYITAYDQNGNKLPGTYPSAVRVTLNAATELDLSVGAYTPATQCDLLSPGTACPNIAAQVVNNSGQVVFGNYGPNYTMYPSQVSISTNGTATIDCAAINFPLSGGSTGYTCQASNPSAPSSKTRAMPKSLQITNWRLAPIVKN